VRPRLIAIVLLALLGACGGDAERGGAGGQPAALVGTADVERLLPDAHAEGLLRCGVSQCDVDPWPAS
jgi:hypothetical protein